MKKKQHYVPRFYLKRFTDSENKFYAYDFNAKGLIENRVYYESQCYKKDVNKVINKNGKNIGTLYEFVSKNFIIYYLSNKTRIIKIESNEDKDYNKFNNEDTNSKIENEEEKTDLLGD